MMQRSKTIAGPYTEKKQLNQPDRAFMEPNQGGIVQTEKGEWFFFTHHGTGQWEGRCASLLPVTWIEGWPIIGQVGADGIGRFLWAGRKPVTGTAVTTPQTTDEFTEAALPPQWEWNYQPRAEKWSLTERPGFLRLHAFKPLKPDDLMSAGNTLTQRALRTKQNVVTAALDLGGMADGQVAGLCHFAKTNSTLGVRRSGAKLALEFTRAGKITAGPEIEAKKIWLRSTWGLEGASRYFYSFDGVMFTPFGEIYPLTWGNYRGDRIGLFSYNTAGESGYVDIDSFRYDYDGSGGIRR